MLTDQESRGVPWPELSGSESPESLVMSLHILTTVSNPSFSLQKEKKNGTLKNNNNSINLCEMASCFCASKFFQEFLLSTHANCQIALWSQRMLEAWGPHPRESPGRLKVRNHGTESGQTARPRQRCSFSVTRWKVGISDGSEVSWMGKPAQGDV